MKKELSCILATTFVTTILSLPVNASINNITPIKNQSEISKEAQQQIITEADEYLTQLIVQNRYTTATRIIWVYGCADKT